MSWTSRFIGMTVVAMLAIGATGFCTPAAAQKVGAYVGTSADGKNVSFNVTKIGADFFLGVSNVSFTAKCTRPSGTTDQGWGFFLNQKIVAGEADFQSFNSYYYIFGHVKFPSNNRITGTITSLTTVFVPGPTPPTASHFCISKSQKFTALFQAAAAAMSIEPGTAVVQNND